MEQWHWNLLYSAGLLGISFYVLTKRMRYNFGREFILNMFCTMQGRKYKWIREPILARRVLSSSSSKGMGVEQLLSTEAFLPIVSLESVIDEQWIRMKDNFVILKSQLPPLDALSTVAEEITKYYLEREETRVIDCPTLVKLTVQIMQAWLFGVPKEIEVDPMIVAAIEEYRKEIAVKGKGDPRLKLYITQWIQEEIRSHKNIYDIFQEKWFSDEYWSLLIQPFFISPAINITDIAITLTCKEFKDEFLLGESLHDFDMERIILCAINYRHPFPIFERWFPLSLKSGEQFIIEPNTHCFVPIDEIGRNCCHKNAPTSNWSAFGAGKRACGGRDIAMTLCTKIFYVMLTHQRSEEKFKPWIDHNYSGRDNDFKETLSQTFYQITRLVQISWKLVRQRIELSATSATKLLECEESSWNMNLTASNKDPTIETEADNFLNDQADRKIKYGIGTIRLTLLIVIFYWVESCSLDIVTGLGMRYGLFGIGGGFLNLHKFSPKSELLILCALISNFVYEYVSCSNSTRRTILFMYLLKTIIGDALAGKLDNKTWFKSLVIVSIIWTVLSSQRLIPLLPNIFQVSEMFYQELFIFGSHLICHCLCELGDNYYEKYVFSRHRYSYEMSCVILYLICNANCNNNNDIPLSTNTLLLFADMFASLLYRVTNYTFLLIYFDNKNIKVC